MLSSVPCHLSHFKTFHEDSWSRISYITLRTSVMFPLICICASEGNATDLHQTMMKKTSQQ